MKSVLFVFLAMVLAGCAAQKLPHAPNLILVPHDNIEAQGDAFASNMKFTGIRSGLYEFEVHIKNLSNESISVSTASFYYVLEFQKDIMDSVFVYSVNPEDKIEQLEWRRDSLLKEKNPYSLEGKSNKEIISEGLISGTIALVFGLDADELELQRQNDECDWENYHIIQLKEVNSELDYWRNNALLPLLIAPNDEIIGKVLFPIDLQMEELEIRVLLEGEIRSFNFIQSQYRSSYN